MMMEKRRWKIDCDWDELNFHDGEILSVNLDYGNKRANLVIQLANPHTRAAVEAQGLYAFLMSCREPWGRGTYIFSVTHKETKQKDQNGYPVQFRRPYGHWLRKPKSHCLHRLIQIYGKLPKQFSSIGH